MQYLRTDFVHDEQARRPLLFVRCFFFMSRRLFIYFFVFLFWTPVRVSLGKLVSGCPLQTWSSVECVVSDFFACDVIDVRLSSAHCITKKSVLP